MKSITPKSAIPGTIDANERRLKLAMSLDEADEFSVSDPVLVAGFSDHGFRDGMALCAYTRSLSSDCRTVLVVFYRRF